MTESKNPYQDLPPENFWRTGVVAPGPFGLENLIRPKFRISREDRVVTAGSCFAQRLSQALVARGYNWVDSEPAPPMLSPGSRLDCNYGVFSFRTGNIYTAAVLRQWVNWAFDGPPDGLEVWPTENGVQDAFRPDIEPGGFADTAELEQARDRSLSAMRRTLSEADVFVFTMGLTEAWRNRKTGLVYPSCPGTVAGEFRPELHELVNFTYQAVHSDMSDVLQTLRRKNPNLRVVLTVSPVPLTATAEVGGHALVANTYTKSLLRTVAGSLARELDYVDYFPGYELVATPPFRGMFYRSNLRTVDPAGVHHVMDCFTKIFGEPENGAAPLGDFPNGPAQDDGDLVCHDYILEYYNEN